MDDQSQTSARKALFQRACRHAKDNKTSYAQAEFAKVMAKCACTRGLTRSPCKCKNYQQAALATPPTVFEEAMYKCSCAIGKTFQKCDDDLHIKSIDYTAVMLMSEKKKSQALEMAGWLLEIAPRRFEGYLRLGQIAMKQNQHAFAWGVYCACVTMARKNHLESDPKFSSLLKIRDPLHRKFCRVNPLHVLPTELNLEILKYLSSVELHHMAQTCKQWRSSITNSPILWRNVVLGARPRKCKSGLYRSLLRYSGGRIERLRFTHPLVLNNEIHNLLLQCFVHLKHLELFLSAPDNPPGDTVALLDLPGPPMLETLSMILYQDDDFDVRLLIYIRHILDSAHENLRQLRLHANFRLSSWRHVYPLAKLQSLAIKQPTLSTHDAVDMLHLPSLEQLSVSALIFENGTTIPLPEIGNALKEVVIDIRSYNSVTFEEQDFLHWYRCIARRMGTMQILRQRRPGFVVPGWENAPTTFIQHLVAQDDLYNANLERVCEVGILDAQSLNCRESRAVAQLSEAFSAGCVRSISVLAYLSADPGRGMTEYRSTCVWGASSILSLVLWLDRFHGTAQDEFILEHDADLVPFIESFPNLKTLVFRDEYAVQRDRLSTNSTIESILRSTSPATKVYIEGVSGAPLDHMMRVGSETGRTVVIIKSDFDVTKMNEALWRKPNVFFPRPSDPEEPTVYW